MSLYCPKCGGLVYARSNASCGHCGAPLPAEFGFTEAEQAAEVDRVLRLNQSRMRPPVLPALSSVLWRLVAAALCLYMIIHSSHWFYWIMAGVLAFSFVEDFYRYSKQKRLYAATKGPKFG